MPAPLEGVLILIHVKYFSTIGWTKSRKALELRAARLVPLQLVSPSDVVQLHLDKMTAIAFIRKIGAPDTPPCARKAYGYDVKSFADSSQFSLLTGQPQWRTQRLISSGD